MKHKCFSVLIVCVLSVLFAGCVSTKPFSISTVSFKSIPITAISAPITVHPGWKSYTNSNQITSIAFDKAGNVWTAGGGLVKWDVKNNTYTKFLPENGLPITDIEFFDIAPDGSLWIAGEGVSRFDGQSWVTYQEEEFENMVVAPNGDVWMAEPRGGETISRFDGHDWTFYSTKADLKAGRVISLAIAPDGLVFVGTFEDGDSWLSVFDGKTWKTYTSGYVYSMAFSPDGTIWLGTWQGIEKLDINTGKSQIVREIGGVGNLAVTSDNKLWFSVCSGPFRSDVPDGVWSFDGRTWRVYTSKDDFISCGVSAIAVAPNEDIWLGTTRGLSRLDGKTWPTYATEDTLVGNRVDQLIVGKDGVPWVLFNGDTVRASRFQNGVWTNYEIDTQPAPDVGRIGPFVPHAKGTAWYGSLNGAKNFDGQTWSTVGLEGEEIRDIAIAPDGKIWFTTYNSVSSLDSSWETFKCGEKLSCTFIDNLLVSPDGSVWVDARNDGILHFDGMQWIPYRQFGENQLYSFRFAENGDLWAIVDDTNNLVRFDGHDWTSFPLPAELEDWRNVVTMTVTSDGEVWIFHVIQIGDLFSVYHFDGKEWDLRQYPQLLPGVSSDAGYLSYRIITASNGVVWVITETGIQYFDDGEWRLVTTDNGVVSQWITTIAEGPDGTIWFGTNYGISQFSPP